MMATAGRAPQQQSQQLQPRAPTQQSDGDPRVYFRVQYLNETYKLKIAYHSALKHLLAHLPSASANQATSIIWNERELDPELSPATYDMATGDNHVHTLRVLDVAATKAEPTTGATVVTPTAAARGAEVKQQQRSSAAAQPRSGTSPTVSLHSSSLATGGTADELDSPLPVLLRNKDVIERAGGHAVSHEGKNERVDRGGLASGSAVSAQTTSEPSASSRDAQSYGSANSPQESGALAMAHAATARSGASVAVAKSEHHATTRDHHGGGFHSAADGGGTYQISAASTSSNSPAASTSSHTVVVRPTTVGTINLARAPHNREDVVLVVNPKHPFSKPTRPSATMDDGEVDAAGGIARRGAQREEGAATDVVLRHQVGRDGKSTAESTPPTDGPTSRRPPQSTSDQYTGAVAHHQHHHAPHQSPADGGHGGQQVQSADAAASSSVAAVAALKDKNRELEFKVLELSLALSSAGRHPVSTFLGGSSHNNSTSSLSPPSAARHGALAPYQNSADEVAKLRNQLSNLETAVHHRDQLQAQILELTQSGDALRREIESMRANEKDHALELASVMRDRKMLQVQINELQEEVESLTSQNINLIEESSVASQNAIRSRNENAQLSSRLRDVESQLQEAKDIAEQARTAFKERIATAEARINTLEESAESASKDATRWQKAAESYQSTVQALRHEVAQAQLTADERSKQCQRVETALRQAEVDRRDDRRAANESDKTIAAFESVVLRREQELNESHAAQRKELEAALFECNSVLAAVQSQLTAAQTHNADVAMMAGRERSVGPSPSVTMSGVAATRRQQPIASSDNVAPTSTSLDWNGFHPQPLPRYVRASSEGTPYTYTPHPHAVTPSNRPVVGSGDFPLADRYYDLHPTDHRSAPQPPYPPPQLHQQYHHDLPGGGADGFSSFPYPQHGPQLVSTSLPAPALPQPQHSLPLAVIGQAPLGSFPPLRTPADGATVGGFAVLAATAEQQQPHASSHFGALANNTTPASSHPNRAASVTSTTSSRGSNQHEAAAALPQPSWVTPPQPAGVALVVARPMQQHPTQPLLSQPLPSSSSSPLPLFSTGSQHVQPAQQHAAPARRSVSTGSLSEYSAPSQTGSTQSSPNRQGGVERSGGANRGLGGAPRRREPPAVPSPSVPPLTPRASQRH